LKSDTSLDLSSC